MSVKLLSGQRLLFSDRTIRQLNPGRSYEITTRFEPLTNTVRYSFTSKIGPFSVRLNGTPLTEHLLPPDYTPRPWGRNPDSWVNDAMNRIYTLAVGGFLFAGIIVFGIIGVIIAKDTMNERRIAAAIAAAAATYVSPFIFVKEPISMPIYVNYPIAVANIANPRYMLPPGESPAKITLDTLIRMVPSYQCRPETAMAQWAVLNQPAFTDMDLAGQSPEMVLAGARSGSFGVVPSGATPAEMVSLRNWATYGIPILDKKAAPSTRTAPLSYLYRAIVQAQINLYPRTNPLSTQAFIDVITPFYLAVFRCSMGLPAKNMVNKSMSPYRLASNKNLRTFWTDSIINKMEIIALGNSDAIQVILGHIDMLMTTIACNINAQDMLIPLTCAIIMRMTPSVPYVSADRGTTSQLVHRFIYSIRRLNPTIPAMQINGPKDLDVFTIEMEDPAKTIPYTNSRMGNVPAYFAMADPKDAPKLNEKYSENNYKLDPDILAIAARNNIDDYI